MSKDPYLILGISHIASSEDIKKAYRNIALICHPDKLGKNISDSEKAIKIERFKEATLAYKQLISKQHFGIDNEEIDWKELWGTFFKNSTDTKEIIKDVFFDLASIFKKNNIHSKSYYNPKQASPVETHSFTLYVTLKDICLNVKKKLRLILVKTEEPLFIDVYCGMFPQINRQYIDDDNLEHEIIINMKLVENKRFEYFISDTGNLDIITNIDIDLLDYIQGSSKNVLYIDDKMITIDIPPFHTEFLEINGKGICRGSFIVNVILKNIDEKLWNTLSTKDSTEMIRILTLMNKTI
jgi:DnaJ-class molecular chaperone